MTKLNRLLILLFHLPNISLTYAQNSLYDEVLRQNFNYEVKQFTQFIDRFNYSEKVQPLNDSVPTKKINLISLLNSQDTGLLNNPNTWDFVNYLSSMNQQISYNDSNWFAVAHCNFNYKNSELPIDIILQLKGTNAKGRKWVIVNIKSDTFLNNLPLKDEFINPMNHDIGFTELTKALNDKKNLFNYLDSIEKPSSTVVFLSMVKSNEVIFKQINSIEFNLLQINNWTIIVKNYNRNVLNSGWLISNILKTNNNEKEIYKQQLYRN